MKRVAVLLTFLFAACGGGPSMPTSPAVNAPSAHGAALTFVLKIPSASSANAIRRPHYVSANTSSVAFTVTYGGTTPPSPVTQTFSVTPGTGACPTTSGTTTCTFSFTVPVSAPSTPATLKIVASDASAVAVASASIPITIDASGANQINATLGGVVATLRTLISPPSVPASPATSVPVTVEAFDHDGNLIVGSYADSSGNAVTIALASSDVTHEPVSIASIANSSAAPSIAYDGTLSAGAGATVTATLGSLSSAATLAIVAGSGNRTAYFETSANTVVSVAVGNSGSTTIRSLTTSGTISNPGITVAPDGTVYALVGANTIDVFAPGQTSGGPLYTIAASGFSASLPITAIAAIRGGTYVDGVLVCGGNATNSLADTYAKGATTAAIQAPIDTNGPIWSVATSTTGNAYLTRYDGSYSRLETYTGRMPSYSSLHGGYGGDLQNEDFNDTVLSSMSGYPWFPVPASGSATANPQIAVDDTDTQLFLYTTNGATMFGETADATYSGSLRYAAVTHPAAFSPGGTVKTMTYDGLGNLYVFGSGTLTGYAQSTISGALSSGSTSAPSSSTTTVSGATLIAGTVGP